MTYAIISNEGNLWVGGPFEELPEIEEGQRVIEIALGYPDTCEWSPTRNGFVDIVAPTVLLTRLEFQRRFTLTERAAIRASTDLLIVDWRELAAIAGDISLVDPDVVAGVNYLESQGLIGAGRAAQILTP